MIDISLHELNKYYGANHVLQGISLEIYNGEKIGLLGRNGAGKTTLFRVLAEDEDYESGTLSKASGKKVEILAQIPSFGEGDTVEDILRTSFAEATAVYHEMKKIEGDPDPKVLDRYGKLMEDYEHLGGYDIDYKIDKICNGMSISDGMKNSLFATLSGGEKTRVNLARILLRECDILLLDEPTNHLDLPSLAWLEQFLRDFKGTIVCISHDRTFLDNVVKRIIEIDHGKAHFYGGSYTFYAQERQLRHAKAAEQYERQQKEIKRIEERAKWFVQNNRFTTKHHAILSRLNHMEKVDRPNTVRKVTEDFKSGGYAAKVVVELDNVHKAFGDKILLDGVNMHIAREDRIALIGANGCGKSTLIKLITGEEPCDAGSVKVSSNIKFAYLPQIVSFNDESLTMLETVRNETGLPEDKARAMLSAFNFRMADVTKKVSALSGGEKSRLKLCLLMQDKVNFLILDEPTNHLDIESREWIEEAIEDFDGTLLMISHDRYFMNKFARRIWHMENGTLTEIDTDED
ncbi:MAG: ATP-binding cassette domain-containing protein [Defluviitaleaceae bacterium]|nr:ATP-binding cassette domain-containing protein [Defluviitaleaceae bacterium]MCL2273784.1 ATP-binding cassette domain-containing protein [Defluviitaleaceae bacterium]